MIVVDLDGPLLDVSARYFAAHQRALAETHARGVHPDAAALWEAKRRRLPAAELLTDPTRGSAYAEAFRAHVEDDDLHGLDAVQPGALAALASLPGAVVLSLRTNGPAAARTVARLGISAVAPCHFVSHAEGGKGDRARALSQGTAVDAVIGDSEADAEVAAAVGSVFVAVTCGIRERAFLERLAVAVVPDLAGAAAWLRGR